MITKIRSNSISLIVKLYENFAKEGICMIVLKNDGSKIIKVNIVIFKKAELEIWIEGAEQPSVVPFSQISTIS